MDPNIAATLLGLSAGAFGYWFANFSMQPVLRYRELRSRVLAELIFFAQVVNADELDTGMYELLDERVLANRKSSADLAACVLDLPSWYRLYLRLHGHSPSDASRHLIGLSNTRDYSAAADKQAAIRRALGLGPED